MTTYVTCKNRENRKVALDICLNLCKEQITCDPFNEAMFDRKKEAEEPAETPAIEEPEEA